MDLLVSATNSGGSASKRSNSRCNAPGQSPRAIAKQLNAKGIPGPGGRPWGDTTIRGHHTRRTGILRNELYIGRLVWNRQRYLRDPQTGKRLARPNPESAWIVTEVPGLRILDQDLWDRVQARLARLREAPAVVKARAHAFWLDRRPRHLLTGRAFCGVCGGTLAAVGRDYLACGAARRHGTCANRRSVRRPALEALILDALESRLMQPELVQAFIAAFHAEVNRQRRDGERAVAAQRQELAAVTRRLASLIDAIADGLRTPGLQAKLEELEARRTALAAAIEAAPAPRPRLHPNLAALYRQKVAALHRALEDPATRAEALAILRGLVARVVLHPVADGLAIELQGAIAAMVAVAGRTDAALDGAALRRSVQVVAGAGFEPATFRL